MSEIRSVANEGSKMLTTDELTALADKYDSNYTPDSKYLGDTVTHYRGFGTRNGNHKSEYSRVAPPKPSSSNLSRPFSQADMRSSGLGVGSGIKSSPTDKGTGLRSQRKCWICQSCTVSLS